MHYFLLMTFAAATLLSSCGGTVKVPTYMLVDSTTETSLDVCGDTAKDLRVGMRLENYQLFAEVSGEMHPDSIYLLKEMNVSIKELSAQNVPLTLWFVSYPSRFDTTFTISSFRDAADVLTAQYDSLKAEKISFWLSREYQALTDTLPDTLTVLYDVQSTYARRSGSFKVRKTEKEVASGVIHFH